MRIGLILILAAILPLEAQTGSSLLPGQRRLNDVLSPSMQSIGKDSVPLVGREVRMIDSQGLGMDIQANQDAPNNVMAGSAMRAAQGKGDPVIQKENDQGLQFFRFNIEPRERIEFAITCQDGDYVTQKYVLMQGKDLVPNAVSKAQEQRCHRVSARLRAKHSEFTNLEDRVLPLMLILQGETGHPFHISITRTMK